MAFLTNLLLNPTGNVDGSSGDTTNRFVVETEQQSNTSNPFGDCLRPIATHGFAKAGIKYFTKNGKSAIVITTNISPFNVTTGQTLQIKINGGSTRTVTFQTGTDQTFTSGAATSDQISNIITKQINYSTYPTVAVDSDFWGQAIVYITQTGTNVPSDDLKVAIYSSTYGTSSSIEIVGGTALTGLGLSIGITTGTAGNTTISGTTYEQLAWLIAHNYPNDIASNNEHNHFSIEVPDSSGQMQSRLAISAYKDVAQILISSAMLITNGYPLTISNSANSLKDLDFSRDNQGRQISRVGQIRITGDDTGGNMQLRVYSDGGVATSLMVLNRLGKYITLGGGLQTKIKATTNSAASTMTALTSDDGNTFIVTGTGTINYIANTGYQAGAELTIILTGAATLTNAAGSPTSTNRALKLLGNSTFTTGSIGSSHTFIYTGTGTGANNEWLEKSRIVFGVRNSSSSLFESFSDVGNGTTVETDLHTYTTPVSTLAINGEKILSNYSGTFVSSGTATRQIKVYFGGTVIFDTGAITISSTSSWDIKTKIIRVSATVIRYSVTLTTQGASLSAYTSVGELTGLTLSNTNILKITGQAAGVGAATNDILLKLSDGEWKGITAY